MIKENNNAQFYIDKLKNGEHFSFSRWGDGEWLCVMGANGQNCDKHKYFKELSVDLGNALKKDKGYYKAIWSTNHGQIKRILPSIEKYINNNDINVNWVNAIVWEDLVIREDITELTNVLKNMNFVIVSESSKRNLPVKYIDFIEIPKINCYLEKDRIKQEMIDITNKYENVVFGLSASMTTNVIIDELYELIGDKCWMIDFGSIWDAFIGNKTRSYHSEYKTFKL